jgi:putative transcriptional regulator
MREWLVVLRKEKGYTQKKLAQQIGISRSYYNDIEHGKDPSGKVALRICEILDCDMEQFYKGEE